MLEIAPVGIDKGKAGGLLRLFFRELPGANGLLCRIEEGIGAIEASYDHCNLCNPCRLVGAPAVGAVEDAIDAGSAGYRFHLDGIEGKAVPDIGGKDADTVPVYPVTRID